MADEATTDATNSEAAPNPTGASAATEQPSSTTQPTESEAQADPLDTPSLLADAAVPAKEGDAPANEGEGDAAAKGDAPLTGAPEGDYELTLPEGMALDKAALEAITPTAKALNLSSAGLSKLAAEAVPIAQKQAMDGIVGQVAAQRAAWDADTRSAISGGKNAAGEMVAADPIYGGRAYDDVLATAAKAIDAFGGDKLFPGAKPDGTPGTFRDFLRTTGLGNHPGMMAFAYRAGSAISEDTDFQRGGNVPNTPRSREEKYYGANG